MKTIEGENEVKHVIREETIFAGIRAPIEGREELIPRIQEVTEIFETFPARLFRSLHVWIKLETDVALVANSDHGLEHISKLNGAMAENQMIVDPARGDIFEVNMTYPLEELFERSTWVFTGAIKMADIEVEPGIGQGINLPQL